MLRRLQENVDKGLIYLYYLVSEFAVLPLEIRSLKDARRPEEEPEEINIGSRRVVAHKPELGFNSYLPDILRHKNKLLQTLRTLNVRWLRTDFPYHMLSKGKEEENFEKIDQIVDDARRYRINLLPILGIWTTGSPNPPSNMSDFLKYIENVACRYSGQIAKYEFWNEPNSAWFWSGSIGKFSDTLGDAARKLKEIDRKLSLGINVAWHWSLIGPWALRFIEKLFRMNGLKHIDFIGLHGYPGSWEPGTGETWKDRIIQTRRLLDNLRVDKEIVVTEFGFYAFKNRFFYPHVPEVQTEYFKRSYKAIADTSEVPIAIWYCLNDPETYSNFNIQRLTYQEYGFGLYNRKFEPKNPDIAKVIREVTN